jgi:hypothetical protein
MDLNGGIHIYSILSIESIGPTPILSLRGGLETVSINLKETYP